MQLSLRLHGLRKGVRWCNRYIALVSNNSIKILNHKIQGTHRQTPSSSIPQRANTPPPQSRRPSPLASQTDEPEIPAAQPYDQLKCIGFYQETCLPIWVPVSDTARIAVPAERVQLVIEEAVQAFPGGLYGAGRLMVPSPVHIRPNPGDDSHESLDIWKRNRSPGRRSNRACSLYSEPSCGSLSSSLMIESFESLEKQGLLPDPESELEGAPS
ncbi:hypothetical protein P154DRAFT_570187 [Amniculicola lignicola CBS 123094]|uniref:Uncharacterized protein n=1 Tax=Amniculicola lignicola CBS 123094 TaxID=1392246 RepID=A0A6A5WWC3_9PLEO|nr:hypothetical protein P154DRAFT_570187 [Amniculicola lignicola CBS 123094]